MKIIAVFAVGLMLTACTSLDETVASAPSTTVQSAKPVSDVLDCINSAWVLQASVRTVQIPGGHRLYTDDSRFRGPAHVAEIVQNGKGTTVRYWENTQWNTQEFQGPVMACTRG